MVGVAVGCAGLGGDGSPRHLNPTNSIHTFRKTHLFAEFHLLPLAWVLIDGVKPQLAPPQQIHLFFITPLSKL